MAHRVDWWVHGIVALAFVASIPFTKAVHMIAGPAGVGGQGRQGRRELPPLPANAKSDEVGYQLITYLLPRHLLDLDACTKCGKCHDACPATASGYPLSPARPDPRPARVSPRARWAVRDELHIEPLYDSKGSILGDPIRPETLWSCMQCMACVEICPVGIEHVPIINQMRARLVEHGEMDSQLQSTLETIYTSGNSFGEAKRKRARWAKELEFEIKDARKEPVEYLWYVGDYASFDPRNQKVTQALARILDHAGVDFGILYDAEKTAGNDVRRAGEEGLYTSLAEENIAAIEKCDFQTILSSDPHSFNTLRNEYPELGGRPDDVLHHSQLSSSACSRRATIRPSKRLDYRVTYHDPCTSAATTRCTTRRATS